MSYEYSSESRSLDLPNPFKIENYFYFGAGGILFIAAISLLLLSRHGLSDHLSFWSLLPLLMGVFLLFSSINYWRKALMQLRFFFGRGEPKSLAEDLSIDQVGSGQGADALKETLRQNALVFQEPQGALNGLLYTWIPQLIYAPHPIQLIAQRQFQIGLAVGVTIISLLVSVLALANAQASSWMGVFYYAFTIFLLVKPLKQGTAAEADLGINGLVGLVVFAIFGPVIIPWISRGLPDLSWLSLNWQVFLLLLAVLGAVVLFFVALIKQMIPPPATTMACEQQALSMNSHPKQLLDELERALQTDWTEKIPNRRYARIFPEINNGAGSFHSEMLEETQPMPCTDFRAIDFASSFALPRYRWLMWLNSMGLIFVLSGALAVVIFSALLNPAHLVSGVTGFLAFGAAMLLVGDFCFKAGHVLWGRFDFQSELIWVEMTGNYQSAKLDYGNQFTDRIKTEKQVINIETMTMRVWVAQLETVAFGKNSQRWLIGMRGLPDKARYLSQHLSQFAADQSIIVAPASGADMQKVANLGALNQLGGASGRLPKTLLQAFGDAPLRCAVCNALAESDARFCAECGTPLNAS
ncbi:MAG: zinc ribbon domain-containing protein [Sulfuriferula sp.]|nr:zinc ribbon domain-containing protein [Sulfuriferula sp.]